MKILVTESLAEEGINLMTQQYEVDVCLGLKQPELISIIGGYDALVVRSETKVNAEVINAAHRLQVIGRAGVGVDNIDLEAATRKGIVVVNAPASNTISAAEHTIAMLLSLARNIPKANNSLKGGQWKRAEYTGVEIRKKTLGIIGLGNVGSEVAHRAIGLQMYLIGYDPYISPEYAKNIGVEIVSLNELLKRSDFITLHLPLTEATRGMIGPEQFTLMKPSVRIINCARGGLIDEEALYKALEEGKVAGAALDVFSKEPATNNILFKSEKVIATPHLGASTFEAQTGVATEIAEQVVQVLQNKPARYTVNIPHISPEVLGVIAPYMKASSTVGSLAVQLSEGQMKVIDITYMGEPANLDTSLPKASLVSSILETMSEERVNLVNVNLIAAKRGLKIIEHKDPTCENYSNLITAKITTTKDETTVAATVMRGEVHVVRVNDYWIDIVPTGGYFLFSDHKDRPGLIGAVGNVTGSADINIHSMLVGRLKPRGQALMVLGLDAPLSEEYRKQILAIPGVYTAKIVKF